jgi:hypothetical protein
MVYNTRVYWVLWIFFIVQYSRGHIVSETESVLRLQYFLCIVHDEVEMDEVPYS